MSVEEAKKFLEEWDKQNDLRLVELRKEIQKDLEEHFIIREITLKSIAEFISNECYCDNCEHNA